MAREQTPARSRPTASPRAAASATSPCSPSLREDGRGTIIGEALYAYDATARQGEFAISVADAFQRRGLGLQMLTAMETRAIDLGHAMIAAETARTNAEMRGLARKAGFNDTGLGDWQSVHLAKRLSR
ncbi:N-acetyltransferase family protein [Bradyrhizobium guangxiense]